LSVPGAVLDPEHRVGDPLRHEAPTECPLFVMFDGVIGLDRGARYPAMPTNPFTLVHTWESG
jgi:hypothetical protein